MTEEEYLDPASIPENDEVLLAECDVTTFRAGGPGGQHQNKTESGVRLVHRPTGLRVESRSDRSQHRNRSLALARLRAKLEAMAKRPKPRKATKVSKGQKEKRLEQKRRQSEKKQRRKRPADED